MDGDGDDANFMSNKQKLCYLLDLLINVLKFSVLICNLLMLTLLLFLLFCRVCFMLSGLLFQMQRQVIAADISVQLQVEVPKGDIQRELLESCQGFY